MKPLLDRLVSSVRPSFPDGLVVMQVINPAADLPLGIVGAVCICGALYVGLSLVLCAAVPYRRIRSGAPFSQAFLSLVDPAAPPGSLRSAFLHTSARFVSFGALTGPPPAGA